MSLTPLNEIISGKVVNIAVVIHREVVSVKVDSTEVVEFEIIDKTARCRLLSTTTAETELLRSRIGEMVVIINGMVKYCSDQQKGSLLRVVCSGVSCVVQHDCSTAEQSSITSRNQLQPGLLPHLLKASSSYFPSDTNTVFVDRSFESKS